MSMRTHSSCVVLLSGGLDSTTCLALARAQGFSCHAVSVDYGQRHRFELDAAARVAKALGAASHRTIRLDFAGLGGSALTSDALAVPKDRDPQALAAGESPEIPVTYVPARNLTFLSLALGVAEVLGARDLMVGVNALDYSGYPDCRPEFLRAFQVVAGLATRAGVEGRGTDEFVVHAPLMRLSKGQIVQLALRLGVDFGLTHTCYDPDPTTGRACGRCDACLLRAKGFAEAGIEDPLAEW